jgi:hypothetical protein
MGERGRGGLQLAEDRIHQPRVPGEGDREIPRGDVPPLQLGDGGGHRRPGTGDHGVGGRVLGRQVDAVPVENLGDLAPARLYGHHPAAGRQAAHEPAAGGDERQRVLDGQDAGDAGRRDLADAVPEHDRRTYAPRLPQRHQGVLHREEADVRQVGPMYGLGVRAVHARQERTVQHVRGQLVAPSERGGEHRLGGGEPGAHAVVLAALPAERERHGRRRYRNHTRGGAGCAVTGRQRRRALRQRAGPAGDGRRPMGEGRPAPGRRGCHAGGVRPRPEKSGVGVAERGQRRGVAGGQGQQNRRGAITGRCRPGYIDERRTHPRRRLRRARDDHVGVGAADAERTHPRNPGRRGSAVRPRPRGHRDFHGESGPRDARAGFREVQVSRDPPVPHGERRLDQAQHAGGGLQVAQVGLHRTDQQGALRGALLAVNGVERGQLDRIAQRRGASVRLHVVHFGRGRARRRQRVADQIPLCLAAGHGQTAARAVMVHRRAADHRDDPVAGREGVGQPFEHDDPAALTAGVPVGRRIEAAAATLR